MKRRTATIIGLVVMCWLNNSASAMEYPPEPPSSPCDGVPMTPGSQQEAAWLLMRATRDHLCRGILGLGDDVVLTREILDAALTAKLAEIKQWTVKQIIELKIANARQQKDAAADERVVSLTELLGRLHEQRLTSSDHAEIEKIVSFYRKLLPQQLQHAHDFLSKDLGEAAAAAAGAAGGGAGEGHDHND